MRPLFVDMRKLMLGQRRLRGGDDAINDDGLVDQNSYQVIEVDSLLDVVDHTQTLVGKDLIHRVFSRQRLTLDQIEQKQQALKELAEDRSLREGLDRLLKNAANCERSFYKLLFADFVGLVFTPESSKLEEAGYGYRLYKKSQMFLPQVMDDAANLKTAKSTYLKGLLNELEVLAGTRVFKLMRGPVYMWLGRFFLKHERSWKTPAIKLRLSVYKPVLVPLLFITIISIPYILNITMTQFTVFSLLPFILLLFYVPMVGDFDKDAFIVPLRRLFARSADVEQAVLVLGRLDELMSYQRYAEKNPQPMILPVIKASARQYIKVDAAINPVLGFTDKNYIANDFDSRSQNLAFFTGPNSGGKTAFCKTLVQIQLLSQVGCYVPATSAEMSLSDRLFYQTPEINSLDQDVGRFGTELKRTRDIFKAATPHSVVILDELAEGTTHKEKLETSLMILEAFKQLGSLTILVTHNHELAEHYAQGSGAVFRQVEFDGEFATHRFIDGISTISHADLVARSVGFSKQDIERMLKEKLTKPSSTK